MSKSNSHIGIFEELIRVLSLRKRADFDSFEITLKSIELKHNLNIEKKTALINDLVEHYNKSKPKKNYKILIYILLFSGIVISMGVFFLSKDCSQTTIQMPIETNIVEKSIEKNNNSIEVPVKKENKKQLKPLKRKPSTLINENKVADTINTSIISDTIEDNKTNNDSIKSPSNKSFINHGYYCNLPLEYKFIFDAQSIKLDKKYDKEIEELAEKIINCQNLNKIKITAFYTRKFYFFNNKDLSLKRINDIFKHLKKLHVPLKDIKKIDIELLLIDKKNNPEFVDLVTVQLTNL